MNYPQHTTDELREMSFEELQEANHELMQLRSNVIAEQRKVAAELDRRAENEKVREIVSGLSGEEKQALAQTLAADGIGSQEEFGEI